MRSRYVTGYAVQYAAGAPVRDWAVRQVDICLRFVTGAYIEDVYCDSVSRLAWNYVSSPSGFAFDAVTSVPFSWLDWDSLKA